MSLATLTLGSNTLTPAFDPNVTSYSANITTATTLVTAVAADEDATVTKKLNGSVVSGNTVTWTDEPDVLTIEVAKDGQTKVYTVNVTHNS